MEVPQDTNRDPSAHRARAAALAERVDQMLSRRERSRGWIMKQARCTWPAQEEGRDRLTRGALTDIDAVYAV
ncbi:ribbon-helix-helix domain-containing protein [Pandoraea sputorum]|uniref:Uncharacterized protein n=1 Tax=Pandoraea sputorum TaxID=93222 RepID=A0A5E5BMG6_9BURK|nr:ribbon-helix-helix domain-containing protein [Pandoraea sputorum]VVE85713.1 hypothetical protein PSP31121_05376 [Pandoraea sputorum]